MLATSSIGYTPLSPIQYLLRSVQVWRDSPAITDGATTVTYREFLEGCEVIAGRLMAAGVRPGDRVAVLSPNVREMLECHFAIPGIGAVLVPINIRLSSSECAHILRHSGARVLLAHPTLRELAMQARGVCRDLALLFVTSSEGDGSSSRAEISMPSDECDLLSINYTSGTTGDSKGVMYTHRGAYLQSLAVINGAGLTHRSVYLWTLPMFHCHGWAFVWAITAVGARHICLEKFDADVVWDLLEEGVTHFCGAPTVLTILLANSKAHRLRQPVEVFIGGAPPTPALLERCDALDLRVTHLYGLTETYGPIGICEWKPAWDKLPRGDRARLMARQGVGNLVSDRIRVVDLTLKDVPADGLSLGEVVMRGNNVTVGYYNDPEATGRAFTDGWFHSGDLGVMHPDGYIELKDRAKDIIVSGGENVSTIEIEHVLASHPSVIEVAVVAWPDPLWGEVPKAFVIAEHPHPSEAVLLEWARERLAHFKVPRDIVFVDRLPKTATGKIQKFLLRH